MLIVQKYKKDAGEFANLTSAVTFGSLVGRLKLYFSDLKKVKAKILGGGKVSIPYMILQRDRRRENIEVTDERRKPV
ncbi:hypothetical protein ES708_06919 [subsurface metagenome]